MHADPHELNGSNAKDELGGVAHATPVSEIPKKYTYLHETTLKVK